MTPELENRLKVLLSTLTTTPFQQAPTVLARLKFGHWFVNEEGEWEFDADSELQEWLDNP